MQPRLSIIPAGRLFLRCIIDLSTTAKCLHYHITLNKEAQADIQWWISFLPSWNGTANFLEQEWTDADSLQLYTDASGRLGFAAYWAGEWIRGDWLPHQQLPFRSIQWQELFAIVAATTTWQARLRGKSVRFFCDNEPIVKAWRKQSSKHPAIASLLRTLFLIAAQNNFTIALKHLPGKHNCIADALSRNQLSRFFALAPQANPEPTPLPACLRQL